jgi:O-antigen/teichoic acid export membrane protein
VNGHGPARLRAGSAWALASVAVTLAAAFVRTIVTARFLGPAEIGLIGIAMLALGVIEAIASSGIDTALVAERGDVQPYLDPAFTIQAIRGVAVCALLWLAAPVLAWAFHNARAAAVIRCIGTIAILRGLANPAVVEVTRRLDFQRVFWWTLPEVLASLFLTIVLLNARRDVWAVVMATILGQAIGTAASYGLAPRVTRLVFDRQRMAALLRFGRFVSGSRALMYFSVTMDATVVGMTMGTEVLGLYQLAMRVAELPVVTFTRALGQIALPAFSGLQRDAAALTSAWRNLLLWLVGVNGTLAVGIVAFAEVAAPTLLGDRWLAAVPLIRILAVAMIFRAVIVLVGQLLDAVGRPALTLRLNAARLAALLVLLPLLGAWMGARGVAKGVLVANAGTALLALRFSGRALRADRS